MNKKTLEVILEVGVEFLKGLITIIKEKLNNRRNNNDSKGDSKAK